LKAFAYSISQHINQHSSTAQHSTAQHSIGLFFRGDGSMFPMAMTHGLAPCPKFSEMSISLAVSHGKKHISVQYADTVAYKI
jgi:hypothetical protein